MKQQKSLSIRKTKTKDIDSVMNVYDKAKIFMAKNDNASQWAGGYPPRELILQDIEENSSFICQDEEGIVGVFYFSLKPEPTYEKINGRGWLNEEAYGVIHRIAIERPGRAVASFCYDWCLQQCDNLRIDTHVNNIPMQKSLAKNGFVACRTIRIGTGADDERIAFQKIKTART